jgi:hypothetical protein
MRRIVLLLFLLLTAPALGAEPPMAQVPMLPLAGEPGSDVETLVGMNWENYWRDKGHYGFGPEHLRVGRFDLDGDGVEELIVVVDKPEWLGPEGKPLVVATWRKDRWRPVGWGWGDEDTIFVTGERVDGWHSIDGGNFILRWAGRDGYARVRKAQRPAE